MKEIRLKTIMAGPDGVLHPGQVVSMEDAQADDLVEGGYAEYTVPARARPVETAVAPVETVEKAVTRSGPARRGRTGK